MVTNQTTLVGDQSERPKEWEAKEKKREAAMMLQTHVRGKAVEVQQVEHIRLTVFVCSVPRCVLTSG